MMFNTSSSYITDSKIIDTIHRVPNYDANDISMIYLIVHSNESQHHFQVVNHSSINWMRLNKPPNDHSNFFKNKKLKMHRSKLLRRTALLHILEIVKNWELSFAEIHWISHSEASIKKQKTSSSLKNKKLKWIKYKFIKQRILPCRRFMWTNQREAPSVGGRHTNFGHPESDDVAPSSPDLNPIEMYIYYIEYLWGMEASSKQQLWGLFWDQRTPNRNSPKTPSMDTRIEKLPSTKRSYVKMQLHLLRCFRLK